MTEALLNSMTNALTVYFNFHTQLLAGLLISQYWYCYK